MTKTTKEELIRILQNYPANALIIGIRLKENEMVIDGCVCGSKEDVVKEKRGFEKFRIFKLVELK